MSSSGSGDEIPRSANPNGRRSQRGRGPQSPRITRRAALSGAALFGVGAGLAADRALHGHPSSAAPQDAADGGLPFHGAHQAGIATPQQGHLNFVSFDLTTRSRSRLRQLLDRWTHAAAALTAGRPYTPSPEGPLSVPADTGEAAGLPPARLTLTFGFGASLFESRGRDRFGLARMKPAAIEPLPSFSGELLDHARSGGDLSVQACADDPQVAFHAIHVLSRIAAPDATLRWAQLGFWTPAGSTGSNQTARNLIGFKDGTDNIHTDDQEAMNQFVWVGPDEHPAWMRGGSYLIARRIDIVLQTWDALTLSQQEHTIGRHKQSGAPLGGTLEHDPVDLTATDSRGNPIIPLNAHIRLASPAANGGQRILRRGYSYSSGSTPGSLDVGGHQLDGGLFFIAFVRDPARQFIPIQRRLAAHDVLSAFTVHTSSSVFACPPGIGRDGYIGQQLLE